MSHCEECTLLLQRTQIQMLAPTLFWFVSWSVALVNTVTKATWGGESLFYNSQVTHHH